MGRLVLKHLNIEVIFKYEESKYLAEKEAFEYTKDYEFVSINPSSVQGPEEFLEQQSC